MSAQPPPERGRSSLAAVVVGLLIALLGAGWFVLSHVVNHTEIPDALGETLGVVLGLLVVASVYGAIRSSRGKPG